MKENEISKVLDNLITNNPHLADYIKMPDDVPYYLNYVELIKKFNPKAFVVENVRGLVSMWKGEVFKDILSEFETLNYDINFN